MKHDAVTDQTKLSSGILEFDKKAFDECFRAMYPRLVRFACKITHDWNASCDITQDVFVMLWQQRDTIDPDRSVRGWLYRSVRNRSFNYLRDRKNAAGQEVIDTVPDDSFPVDGDPHSDREAALLDAKLREWIRELPERQREAFELSRFEGLIHDEVAAVMEVSPKTVNNHLTAALKQIREKYAQFRMSGSGR
ncbi:RNA polymerase sigma-70 factor [Balneolales bacterium ANBcel1]|nr:RNA polymerase sigma-70 factor [Balneolales bacterium ANBcel1]